MFKDAKVGDKVWCITTGWTEIKRITPNSIWPIYTDCRDKYTFEGKNQPRDLNPSLFWDEIKIEIPKNPLPKLEVDTKVVVWDNNAPHRKFKRHFNHFEDGKIVVFGNGSSSWNNDGYIATYDNWELYDETKDKE